MHCPYSHIQYMYYHTTVILLFSIYIIASSCWCLIIYHMFLLVFCLQTGAHVGRDYLPTATQLARPQSLGQPGRLHSVVVAVVVVAVVV